MQVDKNYFGFDLFQQLVGDAKRIVIGRHEDASLKIDHRVRDSILLAFVHTPARKVRSVIRWPQQAACGTVGIAVSGLKVFDDLALIPNMIASGDDIDAEIEQ